MRLLLIISLTFTILADAAEPEVKIQAAIDHNRRTGADGNAYFPWTEGRYASLRINSWGQWLVNKDLGVRA